MTCRYVSYLRVSTKQQGHSGLGLEGQRAAVQDYARRNGCEIVDEFQEVESGRQSDRPQLRAAINRAVTSGATLIIAKLDRLTRDVRFLYQLRDEGVDFLCCDMPSANKFMVNLMINIAEHEAELISKRTKDALAAAKARGVKLGGPLGVKALGRSYLVGSANGSKRNSEKARTYAARLADDVKAIQDSGTTTLQGIADALNAKGVLTSREGQWRASTVARLLKRI